MNPIQIFSLATADGWAAYSVSQIGVATCNFGFKDKASAEYDARFYLKINKFDPCCFTSAPGTGPLHDALTGFFTGKRVDFRDIRLDDSHWTDFQKRVYHYLHQNVCYGMTISYMDLARMTMPVPSARAIGQAMARNPTAPVIPCHRVIGSHGELVGYSGKTRLGVKAKLLDMESGRSLFN